MNKEEYFEKIKEYSLLAKKEIGQNFLIDQHVAERIVEEAKISDGDKVLEIGCGAGSLTYFLVHSLGTIDAIDIDEAMLTKVKNDFEKAENIRVFNGNAMRFDYSPYSLIVGNLPYYITSGIVEKVLLGANNARRVVFMVQKEALDRLLAKPNTKEYGPLAILIELSGKATKLFNVSRNSFSPIPHVESAVFKIELNHDVNLLQDVYRLAESLFLQRRKTIYNNLKNYLGNGDLAKDILEKNEIELTTRPEQLFPSQYLHLCEAIKNSRISTRHER